MQIVRTTHRPRILWLILRATPWERLLLKVRIRRVGIGYLAGDRDHLAAVVLSASGLGRDGVADLLAAC
jgi:hypothetical protein